MANLNYVVPCNIILEIIMIGVQSYVYDYSSRRFMYSNIEYIDPIYLGIVVAFLVISVAWVIYFKKEERTFNNPSHGIRILQGVILLIVGSIMIKSAQTVEHSNDCQFYTTYNYGECQRYTAKIVAGIFALLNGILYFICPCKFVAVPVPMVATPPTAFVGHNLGYVEAPPSYFPQEKQAPEAGTYFMQYQPGGQIVTQHLQSGYYAPPPHAGLVHSQAGVPTKPN